MTTRQVFAILRGTLFGYGILLACAFGLLLTMCQPKISIGKSNSGDHLIYLAGIEQRYTPPLTSGTGIVTPEAR